MNVKDVYLSKYGKFILFISIIPGLNLNLFDKLFIDSLTLEPIYMINKNINDLPNSIDTTDYNKLNEIIKDKLDNYDNLKNVGQFNKNAPCVVVFGYSFDYSRLLFDCDAHLHLYLSKDFSKSININLEQNYKKYNDELEKFNVKKNIKFIKISSYDNIEEILDKIFLTIINFWEMKIYPKKNLNLLKIIYKMNKFNKVNLLLLYLKM